MELECYKNAKWIRYKNVFLTSAGCAFGIMHGKHYVCGA